MRLIFGLVVQVIHSTCPTELGWQEHTFASNQRCFKSFGPVLARDIESTCAKYNATILAPKSQTQANDLRKIYRTIDNCTEQDNCKDYFLGIKRYHSCDDWYDLATNKKQDYFNWRTHEPSDNSDFYAYWRWDVWTASTPDSSTSTKDLICARKLESEKTQSFEEDFNCTDYKFSYDCNGDSVVLSIEDCFNGNFYAENPTSKERRQIYPMDNCGKLNKYSLSKFDVGVTFDELNLSTKIFIENENENVHDITCSLETKSGMSVFFNTIRFQPANFYTAKVEVTKCSSTQADVLNPKLIAAGNSAQVGSVNLFDVEADDSYIMLSTNSVNLLFIDELAIIVNDTYYPVSFDSSVISFSSKCQFNETKQSYCHTLDCPAEVASDNYCYNSAYLVFNDGNFTLSDSHACPSLCDDGWEIFTFGSQQRCLKYMYGKYGNEIQKTCSNENGIVPIPRTKEENDQLSEIVRKVSRKNNPTQPPWFWIGIEQYNDCNQVWREAESKKLINFTNWANGHPDNAASTLAVLVAGGTNVWYNQEDTRWHHLACIDKIETNEEVIADSLGCDLKNLTLDCTTETLSFTLNECYDGDIYASPNGSEEIQLVPTSQSCKKKKFQLNSTDPSVDNSKFTFDTTLTLRQNTTTINETNAMVVQLLRDKVHLQCHFNQTYTVQDTKTLHKNTNTTKSTEVTFSNAPIMSIYSETDNKIDNLQIGEKVRVEIIPHTSMENTNMSVNSCIVSSDNVSISIIENGAAVPVFGSLVEINQNPAGFNLTVFQIGQSTTANITCEMKIF